VVRGPPRAGSAAWPETRPSRVPVHRGGAAGQGVAGRAVSTSLQHIERGPICAHAAWSLALNLVHAVESRHGENNWCPSGLGLVLRALGSEGDLGRGSAVGFRHPWAFWFGVAAVTGGVLLHLPMFLGARSDHYVLRGMPMDNWMLVGMALMVVGYGAVIYGLSPRFSRAGRRRPPELEFEALDETRLSAAHIKLMLVLVLAVAVDTQKPFTFTFILPGVASEYDLRSPSHLAPGHWPVALFPFVAIIGTVLGSVIWGRLGDSIGRRASILRRRCSSARRCAVRCPSSSGTSSRASSWG